MPLLTPPDILPEAMRFLLRALLATRDERMPWERLVGLVAPSGMAEAMKTIGVELSELEGNGGDASARTGGATIADKSLDALVSLGIVDTERNKNKENREVWISDSVRARFPAWEQVTAAAFAAYLREVALHPPCALGPLGVEAGDADLAQALALLHSAPVPLRAYVSFETEPRTFADIQLHLLGDKARWPIGNEVRWPSFLRWALYLGFGAIVPVGAGRGTRQAMVADASAAVSHVLPEILPESQPVGHFVAALGAALPVLDGGAVHAQISAALLDPPPPDEVSPGLALSLWRLHHSGMVKLEYRSDRDVLQFPMGEGTRPVSHISPGGKPS